MSIFLILTAFIFPLKTLIKTRCNITFLELGCRNPVFRADFRRLLCAILSCFAFDGCAGAFVVLVISLCCAGDVVVLLVVLSLCW